MNLSTNKCYDMADSELTNIKKELRAAMNGILSGQMRQSGMPYKLVFGVELPRLQSIAKEFTPKRELAQHLWNENIRESKLLACMLMPQEEFLPEMAEIWVEEIPTAEVAQIFVMFLFGKMKYAPSMAFEWIATSSRTKQLCGFLCLARKLQQGETLNEWSKDELLDQANSLISTADLQLKKAIQACLLYLER